MNLAEKLIYLRKKQGLTQLELAEKLNISRQAVSRWEVGVAVPSTDNLKILAELYGIQIDFLLNDSMMEMFGKEETTEIKRKENKKRLCKRSAACVLVIILIIIFIVIWIERKDRDNQATPIRDMNSRVEDDYTICAFDFDIE